MSTMPYMADDGKNVTPTQYDYSYYYELLQNFTPCDHSDVRDFGKVFLPTIYILVFVLGFIGNGLVVCILVRYRHKINLTDTCLLNLALADLLFVLTLPLYAHNSSIGQWTFGDFMCRAVSGAHNIGFFCNIFFMILMTIDRYIAITFLHKSLPAGGCLCVVIWLLSFGISLPVFIFTQVKNDSHGFICDFSPENAAWKHYNLFMANTLGLVIPMFVMVICYSRIIVILNKTRGNKKHRVVKLIISIMAIFFLFWAPYNIILFLTFLKSEGYLPGDTCSLENNLKLSITVTETLAYTHCCLNPFIYGLMGQKFRKRGLQFLRECVSWIPLSATMDMSDSTVRRSLAISRSSEVTSTFIK